MQNNGIEMTVHVNGRSVKEYTHQGMSFIEARDGTNYTIKLKNNLGQRAMAVVSVDGLDVVSGKNAAETDTGYIIDAHESTEIKGYRISDNDSAAFVFTNKGKSYVQNVKGDARNCGVIGVRAFSEKVNWIINTVGTTTLGYKDPIPYTVYCNSYTPTNTMVPLTATTTIGNSSTFFNNAVNAYNSHTINLSTTSAAPSGVFRSVTSDNTKTINVSNFDTGTGWGKKQEDKITRVSFEKGILICEMTIYYASKIALMEMGVDMSSKKQVGMPKAFGDYCKPPKGWVG
jgi:hypothetical protein